MYTAHVHCMTVARDLKEAPGSPSRYGVTVKRGPQGGAHDAISQLRQALAVLNTYGAMPRVGVLFTAS